MGTIQSWQQVPTSRDKQGRLVPFSPNHQISLATFTTWTTIVPAQYDFTDLHDPALWRQVERALQERAGRPKPGDLVRVIAADDSYDAFFVIKAVDRGYKLQFSHGRLPESAD